MRETREQAIQAQRQMEEFAALAHRANVAIDALYEAFFTLMKDQPDDPDDDLTAGVARLCVAAELVATIAYDWARNCNVDFDPADKNTFTPEP